MAGDITPGKVYELLPEEKVFPGDENTVNNEKRNNREREILMRLEYEEGEGKEGGKGDSIIDGFFSKRREDSWSIRDSNITIDGMKQTINPILHFQNKIYRNEKILEKGTKIHLRVRTKRNNHSVSNHMMKKNHSNMNQSDSDMSSVVNNKVDKMDKDSSLYTLHKSKIDTAYTKVGI
jgi:hypothetical protein